MKKADVGALIRWIIIIGLIVFAIWGAVKIFSRPTVPAVAPIVPTQFAPAPIAEPEVKAPADEPEIAEEEELNLIELRSGENAAVGLEDPAVNPKVTLQSGEGLMVSSDPGGFSVSDKPTDSENFGYMAYIVNQTEDPIDVVFHTGWNEPNHRWNIHIVVFHVNEVSALREHVQDINSREQKPSFFGYIFSETGLVVDPDL